MSGLDGLTCRHCGRTQEYCDASPLGCCDVCHDNEGLE